MNSNEPVGLQPDSYTNFEYDYAGNLVGAEDSHGALIVDQRGVADTYGGGELNYWASRLALGYAGAGWLLKDSPYMFGITKVSRRLVVVNSATNPYARGNQYLKFTRLSAVGLRIARAAPAISLFADYSRYKSGEISSGRLKTNLTVLGVATVFAKRLGVYGWLYSVQDAYNEQVGQLMYSFAMSVSPDIEVPYNKRY